MFQQKNQATSQTSAPFIRIYFLDRPSANAADSIFRLNRYTFFYEKFLEVKEPEVNPHGHLRSMWRDCGAWGKTPAAQNYPGQIYEAQSGPQPPFKTAKTPLTSHINRPIAICRLTR